LGAGLRFSVLQPGLGGLRHAFELPKPSRARRPRAARFLLFALNGSASGDIQGIASDYPRLLEHSRRMSGDPKMHLLHA
jgi:hypothetical protein